MNAKGKAVRPRAVSPVNDTKPPRGSAAKREPVPASAAERALAEEAIRAHAYQLWLQDPARSPQENWIQAERDLRGAAAVSTSPTEGY